jgi:short-chain fatty acids transporter
MLALQLWAQGISSSIPLTLNTPGHALMKITGIVPLTETIFSPYNIIIAAILIFVYAITCVTMCPTPDKVVSIDLTVFHEEEVQKNSKESMADTPASKLENNRLISSILGLICLAYFLYSVGKGGLNALNLNSVNLFTLGLGLLLYKGVVPYMKTVSSSAKSIIPIMILYPFYSAISSMIINSGIGTLITNFFASIANGTTLPAITYLAAGFINVLVPADGGHLVLQGPIFLPLAEKFGVPTGYIVMAMTIGANWSNMLQPFWALPALALAKLGIRDIMGYCIVVLIVSGIISCVLLTGLVSVLHFL